ncbi:methyltransferase domain-containing protein [Psittacicella hinzii]
MAQVLIDFLLTHNPNVQIKHLVDLGAGLNADFTVKLLNNLASKNLASALQIDLVDLVKINSQTIDILDHTISSLQEDYKVTTYQQAAQDWLPANSKADLVISNAMVQWLADPQEFLTHLEAQVLAPHGILLFSMFTTNNFHELAAITKQSLTYYSLQQWQEMLKTSGFEIVACVEYMHPLYFASVKALLEHLKLTGVNNLAQTKWNKKSYYHFYEQYEKLRTDYGIPLTYNPLCFMCKKVA